MVNRFFLKLALLPSGIYRRMGVNPKQLRAILHTKLIIDDRRPGTLQQTRNRKKPDKPVTRGTIALMFLSTLMGFLYLLSFMVGSDPVTHLTIFFSFFFFMLSATLISDFTSVLIDVRDNYIILPKPVNDRTFMVARLLHIFIHICKMVVPMSLPGFVKMLVSYGMAGGLIFFVMVFFVTLFSIFFINAVYIIILRITTPQRFQSIISYVQIIFAILVYASYQLLPRLISRYQLQDLDISAIQGMAAYPMYWLANTWQVLYTLGGTNTQLFMAGAGLLLPFLSIYIVVKYLAPTFNNKLAMINSSASAGATREGQVENTKKKFSYSTHLSRMFTQGPIEKMGFLFTWKMTSRSRDFKMKVYPSIGYLLVYVVIMFMNNRHLTLDDIAAQQNEGKIIVISALYFTSLLLTMAINQIVYSEKYKASWIYYVTPISKPGEVIMGAAKAAILKFYIPMVVFITLTGIILVGPQILPNIFLGLFNELLIATSLVFASHKMFPFSKQQNNNVKGGSFLRGMSVLIFSAIIAVGHFLIYEITAAVILCAILSMIATWMMMGSIKGISWSSVKSSYSEVT